MLNADTTATQPNSTVEKKESARPPVVNGSKLLSDYIHISKYANYHALEHRREKPEEANARVCDMHRQFYGDKVESYVHEVQRALDDKIILGSQRAQQYGGRAILSKAARSFNCTYSYADRPRFFAEAFWLLLCGCGTGFSVQKHHVAKLPDIGKPKGNGSTRTYTIPDTIEGWADSLDVLLDSYFNPHKGRVVFDYSLIRPAGSPLSTSTGTAPGPDPLRIALEAVRAVIDRRLEAHGSQLRPIDVYDIVMHASDAVLSGGVRRSASICLFSADDKEMMSAKAGDWWVTNPQRARSNNSVVLLRNQVTFDEYEQFFQVTKQWGEPGFFWTDSTEHGINPCAEIGMFPVSPITKETGWSFCNLSTVNVEMCADEEAFVAACRAAAYVGTLQAGYTDFSYLTAASREIAEAEALLGVSLTGIMRNPDVGLSESALTRGAQEVMRANAELAAVLGINPAARATCVKPEGTGSLTLMTTPGIHCDHAPRTLRRVQANGSEAPALHFKAANPKAVEPSSRPGDLSLIFAIEAPPKAVCKADVSAAWFMEQVLLVKKAWVDQGVRPERCLDKGLSHNVSNTVDVADHEWETVAKYLYDNRKDFSGVSFLSATGDLDYQQAPFVAVPTAQQMLDLYGDAAVFASGLVVDGIHAFSDLWVACNAAFKGDAPDTDNGDSTVGALRRDWIRRFNQFAERYFAGDAKKCSYCLKHAHLLKMWNDLRRSTVDVDYADMLRAEDVSFQGTVACAGGACQII